jgi:2-dehydropantoate 2-reductase
MKILIYGLGAVGTVFATFLKKAENKVYAITKEKYLKYIKDNLISVQGIWGAQL